MLQVDVAFLPRLIDAARLRGRQAVVIDVLRASSTIIHALAAGAVDVVPCATVAAARQARRDSAGPALLGGERHGQQIEGFDLDNSPRRYTPEVIGGRRLVFTTTNGTRALAAVRSAGRVLIGAFVNRRALAAELQHDGRPVLLVCAGTDGFVTAEDVLFAGAVARSLAAPVGTVAAARDIPTGTISSRAASAAPEFRSPLTVMRDAALAFAAGRDDDPAKRLAILRDSLGGRNLVELGFDADIARCAEDSLFEIVPEYDPDRGVILPCRNAPAPPP
jgi:2-phosphosulfolactate phosphatase